MTLCQYKCGTDLKPYNANIKASKDNPRYELDGTIHDYNRCISIKSGLNAAAEKLDKEVTTNTQTGHMYTINEIMEEIINHKRMVAELTTSFKVLKEDYGKAVAVLSFEKAKNLK